MKNLFLGVFSLFFFISCNHKNESTAEPEPNTTIKSELVNYIIDGRNYQSYIAYNKGDSQSKPVVMVLPEWWGLTDYAKNRAKQLAELGYIAIVVDFYGEGRIVNSPEEAQAFATPFYENPSNAKAIFDAAKNQLSKYPVANSQEVAVIGYCFGGAMALNMARQESDLKGVVSFHGNLMTGVAPNNNTVPILVCNGAADTYVPQEEIMAFKKEMDSAKIQYTFIDYPNALHSFTNPSSTEIGKKYDMKVAYNKEADVKSWKEMKVFLSKIFK